VILNHPGTITKVAESFNEGWVKKDYFVESFNEGWVKKDYIAETFNEAKVSKYTLQKASTRAR